jgi:hypothetical protein
LVVAERGVLNISQTLSPEDPIILLSGRDAHAEERMEGIQ